MSVSQMFVQVKGIRHRLADLHANLVRTVCHPPCPSLGCFLRADSAECQRVVPFVVGSQADCIACFDQKPLLLLLPKLAWLSCALHALAQPLLIAQRRRRQENVKRLIKAAELMLIAQQYVTFMPSMFVISLDSRDLPNAVCCFCFSFSRCTARPAWCQRCCRSNSNNSSSRQPAQQQRQQRQRPPRATISPLRWTRCSPARM